MVYQFIIGDMATIYALTQPSTNRIRYIGKTELDPWVRYGQHLANAARSNAQSRRLVSWIKSIRPETPGLLVLEEDVIDANEAERRWIAISLFAGCRLVNMTPGGDGQPKGYVPSQEARDKNSAAHIGRVKSDHERESLSRALMGHVISDETRRKIGEANRGTVWSEKARARMSIKNTGEGNPFAGHQHSEEVRKRIGEKSKGRVHTEEARRKISEAGTNRHHSDDAKKKISATRRIKLEEARRLGLPYGRYKPPVPGQPDPRYHRSDGSPL